MLTNHTAVTPALGNRLLGGSDDVVSTHADLAHKAGCQPWDFCGLGGGCFSVQGKLLRATAGRDTIPGQGETPALGGGGRGT